MLTCKAESEESIHRENRRSVGRSVALLMVGSLVWERKKEEEDGSDVEDVICLPKMQQKPVDESKTETTTFEYFFSFVSDGNTLCFLG